MNVRSLVVGALFLCAKPGGGRCGKPGGAPKLDEESPLSKFPICNSERFFTKPFCGSSSFFSLPPDAVGLVTAAAFAFFFLLVFVLFSTGTVTVDDFFFSFFFGVLNDGNSLLDGGGMGASAALFVALCCSDFFGFSCTHWGSVGGVALTAFKAGKGSVVGFC